LKVPLFSLQLTLENLSRAREKTPDRFDEIFLESMKMVDSEIGTLRGIIGRFSDFAKMRQPRMQSVNVNEVLRAAVKSFEAEFQSRGRPPVKPELLLDEYAPKIWADPELLYKGFENVIANSLNAMPMGGTLTVRSAQQNGTVRVEISDTGTGLEGGEAAGPAGLFAAKAEGAGLGLATIQTVVSDHGGRMAVEATPGTGATLRMEFPVGPTPVRAPRMETSATRSKPQTEAAAAKPQDVATKPKPSLARVIDI
jgi:signal transduction histidine kinase